MGFILFFILALSPLIAFLAWLAAYFSVRWAIGEMDREVNEKRIRDAEKSRLNKKNDSNL